MPQNQLRTGNNRPLVEPLKDSKDIRSAVSSQAIHSYSEKRPDYIERPSSQPNGWDKLAESLGQFNPVLNKMITQKVQQFKEEQYTLGQELRSRNKLEWNEFVKENPDYAGLNPHLERGYKAAELNTKAQEYNAFLNEAYEKNNLMHEKDSQKFQEAIMQTQKDWIAANVNSADYDSELYADNFFKQAQAAEGAILSRHTNDRAQENLRLAGEKHSQNFSSTIKNVFQTTENIHDPSVMDTTLNSLAQGTMEHMVGMEASGLSRTQVNDIISQTIIGVAENEGFNGFGKEILTLGDKIQTGTGTLGGRPDFQAKSKAILEQNVNARKTSRKEGYQKGQQNYSASLANNLIKVTELTNEVSNSASVDKDKVMQLMGANQADIGHVYYKNYLQGQKEYGEWKLYTQIAYEETKEKILSGNFDMNRLAQEYNKYGPQKGGELLTLAQLSKSNDPTIRLLGGEAANQARKNIENALKPFVDNEQFDFSADFYSTDQAKSNPKTYYFEAKSQLNDRLTAYIQDTLESKKRLPTEAEYNIFVKKTSEDVIKNSLMQVKSEKQNAVVNEKIDVQKVHSVNTDEFWNDNKAGLLNNKSELINYLQRIEASDEDANQVYKEIQERFGVDMVDAKKIVANQIKAYNIERNFQKNQAGQ